MVKTMQQTVAVVGLGYVGLPVALLARERGFSVVGYDTDKTKVGSIQTGVAPFKDNAVQRDMEKFPIQASADPASAAAADVVIICVPTPVTERKEPDLNPLKEALTDILPHVRDGVLISIESTVNPGVMDQVVVPLVNKYRRTVSLVHCPERINPGDADWTVRTIPRVIGGLTRDDAIKGKVFYELLLDAPVKLMNSLAEAEAVKILENTFRDINIAFINEMAKSFDKLGIDISHVIEGAKTKPFAFMAHYPGNGVGGHCISVDPYYMIERAKEVGFDHEFLRLARHINDSMPRYTIDRLHEGLKTIRLAKGKAHIALLGLTYKRDYDDIRESPALVVRELLQTEHHNFISYDPHVPKHSSVHTLKDALEYANVVMLATDHSEFRTSLTPDVLKKHGVVLVVDGKNALDADGIAACGIKYYGVGRSRSAS